MSDPLDQLQPQPTEEPDAAFAAKLRARIAHIEQTGVDVNEPSQPNETNHGWHLAQLNIGLFNHTLDNPEMAEFVNALDRINGIAEASPGFVWRLTDDEGSSSSYVDVPGATDPLIAPNLSVWTGVEALREFMFKTDHVNYLRRRADWFQKQDKPLAVLWWIKAGTIPTLEDGVRRIDLLDSQGSTEQGWTFAKPFPPPAS